ncbi:hypothetical protein [Amycolatopsis azurea]|uniref:Uncharacterized protein n=1 Tax=Amycolatopsis azurea DSM 43854 TaxID=1238180 RepID=M2PQM2_9PSEU|nr:hypothetical protein [Amycolatopsis azurea]EMD21815.1 hypothetical protein C791_0803 [Amycolatopsis azurea DSM 43854]
MRFKINSSYAASGSGQWQPRFQRCSGGLPRVQRDLAAQEKVRMGVAGAEESGGGFPPVMSLIAQ